MSLPRSDDDRFVEFDDDQTVEPIRDDWDAQVGAAVDDERLLIDEVPPHWG